MSLEQNSRRSVHNKCFQMKRFPLTEQIRGKKTNYKHKFHLDFGLVPFPSVTSRSKIIWFYSSQASLKKVGVIKYAIKQILSFKTVSNWIIHKEN